MPFSRDPRNDRRRRVLRDSMTSEQSLGATSAAAHKEAALQVDASARRGAGYSHEVRKACSQRLVQLIPVRRVSYLAACVLSIAIPTILMLAHYMIYVSGTLRWYGHPLAASLDASHPSSIVAWFGSHLWLVCLAATLLTFQLRRHKLDDYRGEYRLWFWLVITCLLASLDATTRLSELIGLAIDGWCQINLGLGGPMVTTATLAVLIGMLGLRLCSELKTVPLSLVLWLAGLSSWAGSAALAQEEFLLEITLQYRIWLKAALWIGGLTAIWLSALTYLRAVYQEAQQRFLARSRMASSRFARNSKMQKSSESTRKASEKETDQADTKSRWNLRLPSFTRQREENALSSKDKLQASAQKTQQPSIEKSQRATQAQAQAPQAKSTLKPSRLSRLFRRSGDSPDSDDSESLSTETSKMRSSVPGKPAEAGKAKPAEAGKEASKASADAKTAKAGRFSSWIKPAKDDDDAAEFHKVKRPAQKPQTEGSDSSEPSKASARSLGGWLKSKTGAQTKTEKSESEETSSNKKGWFSRGGSDTSPSSKSAATKSKAPTKSEKPGGFLARFRLQPPATDDSTPKKEANSSQADTAQNEDDSPDTSDSSRSLTKAERRRMRRLQQKQNRAA